MVIGLRRDWHSMAARSKKRIVAKTTGPLNLVTDLEKQPEK